MLGYSTSGNRPTHSTYLAGDALRLRSRCESFSLRGERLPLRPLLRSRSLLTLRSRSLLRLRSRLESRRGERERLRSLLRSLLRERSRLRSRLRLRSRSRPRLRSLLRLRSRPRSRLRLRRLEGRLRVTVHMGTQHTPYLEQSSTSASTQQALRCRYSHTQCHMQPHPVPWYAARPLPCVTGCRAGKPNTPATAVARA